MFRGVKIVINYSLLYFYEKIYGVCFFNYKKIINLFELSFIRYLEISLYFI